MTFIHRVLVPTDFSDPAHAALHLAAQLARQSQATVTLLHADPLADISLMMVEPVYVPPTMLEKLSANHDRRVETALTELAREIPDDVSTSTVHRRTDPVEAIVTCAAELEADLIVMGSHGRGASRLLLGSTAEKASRAAPAPVLVVREPSRATDTGVFSSVVVGIDYSPFSPIAARLGAQLVSRNGSLELCHVWEPPHSTLSDIGFGDASERAAETEAIRAAQAATLSEFTDRLALEVPVTSYLATLIPGSNVATALIGRAQEQHADLIVVGAHARDNLAQRLLGTHADRVLRRADIPVLLIPEQALSGPWRGTGDHAHSPS